MAEPPFTEQEQLVAGLRATQPEAYSELCRTYGPRVHRFLAQQCFGEASFLEDLLVRVLVEAGRSISRFHPQKASFTAWLYRIAHRHLPRRALVPASEAIALTEDPNDPDPLGTLAARQMAQLQVSTLRRTLSPLEMEALLLHGGHGLTEREIGYVVGQLERSVHTLLAQVRQQMSEKLSVQRADIDHQVTALFAQAEPTLKLSPGWESRVLSQLQQPSPLPIPFWRRWRKQIAIAFSVLLLGYGVWKSLQPYSTGEDSGALDRAIRAAAQQHSVYFRIRNLSESASEGHPRETRIWKTADGRERTEQWEEGQLANLTIRTPEKLLTYSFPIKAHPGTALVEDLPPSFPKPPLLLPGNALYEVKNDIRYHDAFGAQYSPYEIQAWKERIFWGYEKIIVEIFRGDSDKDRYEFDPRTGLLTSYQRLFYSSDPYNHRRSRFAALTRVLRNLIPSGRGAWKETERLEEVQWKVPTPDSLWNPPPPPGTQVTHHTFWSDRLKHIAATATTRDWKVVLHSLEVDLHQNIDLVGHLEPLTPAARAALPTLRIKFSAVDNQQHAYQAPLCALIEGSLYWHHFLQSQASLRPRPVPVIDPKSLSRITLSFHLPDPKRKTMQAVTLKDLPVPCSKEMNANQDWAVYLDYLDLEDNRFLTAAISMQPLTPAARELLPLEDIQVTAVDNQHRRWQGWTADEDARSGDSPRYRTDSVRYVTLELDQPRKVPPPVAARFLDLTEEISTPKGPAPQQVRFSHLPLPPPQKGVRGAPLATRR